jgi:hypothetical protein
MALVLAGPFLKPSEIRILTICFGGIQVIYLYEKIEQAMSPFITGYLTFSYVALTLKKRRYQTKQLNKVDARQEDVHYSVTEATTKMIESPTESS